MSASVSASAGWEYGVSVTPRRKEGISRQDAKTQRLRDCGGEDGGRVERELKTENRKLVLSEALLALTLLGSCRALRSHQFCQVLEFRV